MKTPKSKAERLAPVTGSPSLQLALAELADWAMIEAKAADSTVAQNIWLQVRDWSSNGALSGKVPKAKHPLPPDTDILEALEARVPGIIATGARWARKANDKDQAQPENQNKPSKT